MALDSSNTGSTGIGHDLTIGLSLDMMQSIVMTGGAGGEMVIGNKKTDQMQRKDKQRMKFGDEEEEDEDRDEEEEDEEDGAKLFYSQEEEVDEADDKDVEDIEEEEEDDDDDDNDDDDDDGDGVTEEEVDLEIVYNQTPLIGSNTMAASSSSAAAAAAVAGISKSSRRRNDRVSTQLANSSDHLESLVNSNAIGDRKAAVLLGKSEKQSKQRASSASKAKKKGDGAASVDASTASTTSISSSRSKSSKSNVVVMSKADNFCVNCQTTTVKYCDLSQKKKKIGEFSEQHLTQQSSLFLPRPFSQKTTYNRHHYGAKIQLV